MRADRLVAMLLLLQERGQVTAAEVAAELEISERTARRDLDALGIAGLPVYSVRGRGGGWRLLGGGRTDLSGLTTDEARALFLVAGPHAATTPTVRAALRKLLRALPEPFRDEATAAATAMLSDPTPWRGSADRPPPPQLSAAQDAVIAGKELRLEYVDRAGTPTTRRVDPLGIVAKGAQWYLVADTDAGRRTFRVDRIRSLEPTGKPAARPEDFDLATAWGELLAEMVSPADLVVATGHIDAEYVGVLRFLLGQRVAVGRPDGEGRVDVVLRGRSPGLLASEIAGLAHHLELTGPPEVREALAALGAQLLKRYASHGQDAVASQTSEG